jgi:hypothetical protein
MMPGMREITVSAIELRGCSKLYLRETTPIARPYGLDHGAPDGGSTTPRWVSCPCNAFGPATVAGRFDASM